MFQHRSLACFMKPLINLLHPFGLAWVGFSLLLVLLWRERRQVRAAWRVALLAWIVLTFTGWTCFADRLLASMERPWAGRALADLPQADVVLFLGGGAKGSRGELIGLDLGHGSDRITTAIDLIRRGKAPVLVAGGTIQASTEKNPSEGVATERWIRDWKLTDVPIHQLEVCANTHEEAIAMKKLSDAHGWKSILLVTSATHMKRSVATFAKEGLTVIPVPCAFRTGVNVNDRVTEWVSAPDAQKVDYITVWIYETLGYFTYWWRGWL
jgi:uncharacterized SAM-binding protein YcdF (DUF218 family)